MSFTSFTHTLKRAFGFPTTRWNELPASARPSAPKYVDKEVVEPSINEKSRSKTRYCSACARGCRGMHSSTICCICHWSQVLDRSSLDNVDSCAECMPDLHAAIRKQALIAHIDSIPYVKPSQAASGSSYNMPPKTCGHNLCILTIDLCCHCSDLRPDAKNMIHVDGKGMIGGSRSSTYCTSCRNTKPVFMARPSRPSKSAYRQSTRQAKASSKSSTVPRGPRIQIPVGPYKECGHLYCHLTLSTCCACADKRPYDGWETAYVDGKGLTPVQGRTTTGYCPACRRRKEHPPSQSYRATIHDLPAPARPYIAIPQSPVDDVVCSDPCVLRHRRSRRDCCICSITMQMDKWLQAHYLARPPLPQMPDFCALCKETAQYRATVHKWNDMLTSVVLSTRLGNRTIIPLPLIPNEALPHTKAGRTTAVIEDEEESLAPSSLRGEDDYGPSASPSRDSGVDEPDFREDASTLCETQSPEDVESTQPRGSIQASSEEAWSELDPDAGTHLLSAGGEDEDQNDGLSDQSRADDDESLWTVVEARPDYS
ncbi:hypothetical protein CALCODRAFT_558984 [Calocera cornea HHB12733]|uniref:Uncharacterized protein n=1 Tax=Calocera cornea HHB12733 TaxID=1353952 RepID=A0A165CET9_9BASI|nr:hypothetical protein CALCODRAFT_558984 [Calocera cornea HHB12733]